MPEKIKPVSFNAENISKSRSYELAAKLKEMLNTIAESPAVKIERGLLDLTPEMEKELVENGSMQTLRETLDSHPDVQLFRALLRSKGVFQE